MCHIVLNIHISKEIVRNAKEQEHVTNTEEIKQSIESVSEKA